MAKGRSYDGNYSIGTWVEVDKGHGMVSGIVLWIRTFNYAKPGFGIVVIQ